MYPTQLVHQLFKEIHTRKMHQTLLPRYNVTSDIKRLSVKQRSATWHNVRQYLQEDPKTRFTSQGPTIRHLIFDYRFWVWCRENRGYLGKSKANVYISPEEIRTFAPLYTTTFLFSHLYKYNHGGSQIFQNARSHLKISRARGVTWTKFHGEGPQILGVSLQNLIAGQPGAWDYSSLHLNKCTQFGNNGKAGLLRSNKQRGD
jgi:hypothetical protein